MEHPTCQACGVVLSEAAAEGLCPKCILLDGLEHHDPTVTLDVSRPIEGQGSQIGRYRLLEKIGEGGMAVVYMAEQKRPLRRKVALKIIKLGMDTRQVIARFEAERQALAMMDHPNIAKVFDAGCTETGRPYFVMELVRGVAITEFCDKGKLNTHERLDLFLQVCQAVQHAHQKGIIHRDLKPSNILVTLHEGKHVSVIIDFGIAKATSHQLTEKTLFTQYAQLIGTPEYMSPEQAEMSRLDVDTRTDIYSLGVLLYELLTGTTPFDSTTLREAGYARMQQIIRDVEPPKPSTRLTQLQASAKSEIRNSKSEIAADLDWIVMKSMDKDRNQRYETANGLALDIQRHLNNEPIEARPPNAAYRFHKMVQRHKLAVVASAAVVMSLVIGLSVATVMFVRERIAYNQLDLSRQAETEQRQRAEASTRQARLNLYVADMKIASIALEEGDLQRGMDILNRHRPKPGEEDLRGFEWRYLWARLKSDAIASFDDGDCRALAYSPDGVRVRDANTLQRLKTLPIRAKTLSFSASGEQLAVGSEEDGRGVTLFETGSWQEVESLDTADYPAAFSPDGHWLVTNMSEEGSFQRLDAVTHGVVATYSTLPGLQSHSRHNLAISPDGHWMTTPAEGPHGTDRIRLWSLADGNECPIDRIDGFPMSAAFSTDGRELFIGAWDGSLTVWDLRDRQITALLKQHSAAIWQVTVAPDGKTIATCGADSTILLWDAETRQPLARLRGHTADIQDLDFSFDSKRLASGSDDGTVKVWDVENLRQEPVLEYTWNPLGFMKEGRRVVTVRPDATLQIWDSDSGQVTEVNLPTSYADELTDSYHGFAFAPETQTVAIGTRNGVVELWHVVTHTRVAGWPAHTDTVSAIRFSSDGRQLATGSSDNVIVRDVATQRELHRFTTDGTRVRCIGFSPDDRWLAYCDDTNIYLCDVTETQPKPMALHSGLWEGQPSTEAFNATAVAFSPDGSLLASSSWDATARLWHVPSGESIATLSRHLMGVPGIAFTPDGKTVVTGGQDFQMKFWNVATGQELMSVPLDGCHCHHRFSPDGRTLAVCTVMANGERSTHLYRAPSWEEIAAAEKRTAEQTNREF